MSAAFGTYPAFPSGPSGNELRPRPREFKRQKGAGIYFAIAAFSLMRGIAHDGAAVTLGIMGGTVLVMLAVDSAWRRKARIVFDGQTLVVVGLTRSRVIARRGAGSVLAAPFSLGRLVNPSQLWVLSPSGISSDAGRGWIANDRLWDLEQLERWRAELGVPLVEEVETLDPKAIEARCPGALPVWVRRPGRVGAVVALAAITVLVIGDSILSAIF